MEQRDADSGKSVAIITHFLLLLFILLIFPISTLAQKNYRNVALIQEGTKVTASGELIPGFKTTVLIDGIKAKNISEKWVSHGLNSWIMLDFGQKRKINKIIITHAGYLESSKYNTADFLLESSDDKINWSNIAAPIIGNQESITTHTFNPIATQHVRVYITKPEQYNAKIQNKTSGLTLTERADALSRRIANTGLSAEERAKKIEKEGYGIGTESKTDDSKPSPGGTCRIYEIEVYGTDIEQPSITVTPSFKSKDKFLKAGESGTLSIKLENKGGEAYNVLARIFTLKDVLGLSFEPSQSVGTIAPGGSKNILFVLTTNENLPKGNIDFNILVSADGGYLASSSISISTVAHSQPQYPADLVIENLQFIEPSGNKALDGYESGKIQLMVTNKGRGEAQNIQVALTPLSSAEGLNYALTQILERINPKSSMPVNFVMTAAGKIASMSRTFRIQASEEFGFDADPVRISFETKAFEAPDMKIEKIAINHLR